MGKNKPVDIGSLLTVHDITAWYNRNIELPSKAEQSFPLVKSKKTIWKTLGNSETYVTEAADPMSLNSKIPVSGLPGFQDIIGEMTSFGKGYEWTADQIEQFNELQADFAQLKNQTAANALVKYYGDVLDKIRKSHVAQMQYMDWTLFSNACEYEFLSANSPYMQGITAMQYPLTTWQKDAAPTSWADPASLILTDIQNALDLGEDYEKVYTTIFINKKWFNYVRSNTQIKNQTISLIGSLVGAANYPSLEEINRMLEKYFDYSVKFEIIDEKITRASLTDVKTTTNPFQDGVAVFAQSTVVGHFEWNPIPIIDPTKEVYENFYVVGNYVKIDPSYAKFYGKARGFPVMDTYADNFNLKIDAVAW